MTQEEKAKAYDDALAHAKLLLKIIGNATLGNLVLKNEFENMFSELKDNEDEGIRKEIIGHFKHYSGGDNVSIKFPEWIAWLEKQGEQKLDTDFSDLRTWKYIVDAVLTEKDGIGQYLDSPFTEEVAKKLQKRFGNIEQKPANNVEPKFKVGDKIISTISNIPYHIIKIRDGYYLTDVGSFIMFNVQDNFELVDQKSAEWSEKDENGLADAIWAIEQARTIAKDENDMGNLWYAETWLKSLKERYTWKPSEEQMKALKEAVDEHFDIDGGDLWHLYEDLKKLKE